MNELNIFTNFYKEIFGDILSLDSINQNIIICHQVNCKGVMNAGLALQIKEKFPEVYKSYNQICESVENSKDLLGEALIIDTCINCSNIAIANIFGQDGYGKEGVYTDYNALKNAFSNLREMIINCYDKKKVVVRIPKFIGCGHGGGDWAIVFEIIVNELINKNVSVEIWTINKE